MKKRFLSLTLVACMAIALLAGCSGDKTPSNNPDASGSDSGPDDKVYTLNIDFPNPETACGYKALVEWEAKVEEESNGRLDINIYSGGALGALSD